MLKPIDEFGMTERNGVAVVDSRFIAVAFTKRHDHVLRDIENEMGVIESVSGEINLPKFGEINFLKSTYKDSKGRKQPHYLLSRDGFMAIVFKYEGREATKIRLRYINRFNEMEAFILSLQTAKLEHPAFTRAIMNAHEEPKHYHFSNEADMINRIVLGMPAKKYRELHNIAKGQSVRPYLTAKEIYEIEELQRIDIGLVTAIADFERRKQILMKQYQRMQKAAIEKGA